MGIAVGVAVGIGKAVAVGVGNGICGEAGRGVGTPTASAIGWAAIFVGVLVLQAWRKAAKADPVSPSAAPRIRNSLRFRGRIHVFWIPLLASPDLVRLFTRRCLFFNNPNSVP